MIFEIRRIKQNKMSQQTLMNKYYKSVNPKTQYMKKSENITSNLPDNHDHNLKKKSLSLKRKKREPSGNSTPSKSPKKGINLSRNNSLLVLNDLIGNNDESKPPNNDGIKTPKSSRDVSISNNSPSTTPNSADKNRKRNLSGSRQRSGSLSPKKKSQSSGSRSVTKHLKNRVPRKLFHNEVIDTGKVSDMIENLNLSRVGIIPKNNYNLDKYYSQTEYETETIDCDIDEILPVYNTGRVIIPREKHAEHLFYVITQVFLNPNNCGYFDDPELDIVFGILSLSEKSQMLFARMIKRKYCWRRSSSVEYPEIDINLREYFQELEEHKLITSDMSNESLETLLTMLSADAVHDICKQSKIPRQSNKDSAVKRILKTSCIKSLFPGMESPATAIRKTVLSTLGHCVCLPRAVISLVDRIFTLFIPAEDVSTRLSDIFLKLTMTKEGTMRFPEIPVSTEYYPVFQNREHLISYVERKNEWRQALEMPKSAKENWETFKTLGREAHDRFKLLLAENRRSREKVSVPRHVERFREEYVCIKIVTSCLEIFKKEDSTVKEAVDMLRNLIAQEIYLQSRKPEWYEELALIELKHNKNPENAALITIEGLSLKNINETAKHILTKRATTLAKRKSGITKEIKTQLKNLSDEEILGNNNTAKVSISANVMEGNHPGRKSTWSIDMGNGDRGYMSVEYRAKYYYSRNGYPEGWHCEGSLPVTLFTLIFWEEIYCVNVPAAYLSAYQKAPLDLYTSDFYNNRKEQIDGRVEFINSLSGDELANLVDESLIIRQHYESLMPTTLAIENEQLRDIVRCMGTPVVLGICKRLISNFSGWRAGFPDLLVWNSATLKCKFVEVKGPGDTLSAKQTLWLRYLENLGAATELCEVKAK